MIPEPLTIAVIFLLGAGTGATLRYLRERQLLRHYRDLEQQLARALQDTMTGPSPCPPLWDCICVAPCQAGPCQAGAEDATAPAAVRAAAQTEVAPLVDAAKARIQQPRFS